MMIKGLSPGFAAWAAITLIVIPFTYWDYIEKVLKASWAIFSILILRILSVVKKIYLIISSLFSIFIYNLNKLVKKAYEKEKKAF